MSIHNIPDKYLNNTIHIFRDSTLIDDVGDLSESLSLAYTSLKTNIQPKLDDIKFEIQGRVHVQDHVAYINRVENDVIRDIRGGDIAYDQETTIRYTVLGVEVWQAADNKLEDTHHIKLRLEALSGVPPVDTEVNTVTAKGKITI
jgi:hypothetical protein